MTKSICFYHSGDMDGKCSATIVKKSIPDVELYPIDYQDIPNFPWNKINKNTEVIMVDFSLPKEQMDKIFQNSKRFIWIDHHKTAIIEMKESKFHGSLNIEFAGCELTWHYFFPNLPIPELIHLIGRWDIWDHSDPRTEPFNYGIASYVIDPNNIHWLDYDIESIISTGHSIMQYKENLDKEVMQNSFETVIMGYKAIAVNAPHGSKKFNQLPNKSDYDIYICFIFVNNGKDVRVSLYTEKDNIDVGEIAKLHGGGGHKQAAGYIVSAGAFIRVWV